MRRVLGKSVLRARATKYHVAGACVDESARVLAIDQPPRRFGVGEDTKEDAKGKRSPRSVAKVYGISLVDTLAVLLL